MQVFNSNFIIFVCFTNHPCYEERSDHSYQYVKTTDLTALILLLSVIMLSVHTSYLAVNFQIEGEEIYCKIF